MKRVGVFLPSGNLGGAEQVLLQIANAYADQGANVTVYLLTNIKAPELKRQLRKEITLICFEVNRELSGIFKFLTYLLVKTKRIKLDYAYTSHVHLNAFVSILRRFSFINVKTHVARESTLIFRRFTGNRLKFFNFLYNVGYQKVDLIICQTELMKAELLRNKPQFLDKNVMVISNPITLLDNNIKHVNPYDGKKYIVSAGRLIPEKGFDLLIDAFEIINRQYAQFELVILGEGSSREALQNQIDDAGMSQKIHMPGFTEDVYPYFTYAEVCVVSSRIEGFPNVLLQMMASNSKVVSTLCAGGIDEIDGIVTCESGDMTGLVNALEKAMVVDVDYARDAFDILLKARDIKNFIKTVENSIPIKAQTV